MLRSFTYSALIGVTLACPLQAEVQVRFIEGAPKDRFIIDNTGSCNLKASSLRIDLTQSSGRLIFDVTGSGAGVEVFQPLEFTEGAEALQYLPTIVDGQTSVELRIASLNAGDRLAFTIDVDDTIGQREITVTGSEIAGAKLEYAKDGDIRSAVFTTDARSRISTPECE